MQRCFTVRREPGPTECTGLRMGSAPLRRCAASGERRQARTRQDLTAPAAAVTETLIAPCASAITRSVLESKAMSASRRLVISGAHPHAVLVLLEVGDRGGDLLLRIGRERLEVDRGLLRQRLLQVRHHRARRGAEQPERGFRFDGELDVAKPQRLLRLIEQRLAPDMHGGLAAEAEEALLLLGVHQQRNQQPVAGSRDGGVLHGDIDRAGAVLGKGAAGELRLHDLVDLGEGNVDRHADSDPARRRRDDVDLGGERAVGLGLRRG